MHQPADSALHLLAMSALSGYPLKATIFRERMVAQTKALLRLWKIFFWN